MRENFEVILAKNKKVVKAKWLFSRLKMNQFDHYPKIVSINGVTCYISASVIQSKPGTPECQFLISFKNPVKSKDVTKKMANRDDVPSFKTSRFTLKNTPDRPQADRKTPLISIIASYDAIS
jgi:hypothetical protein